ncbi:MAG TPA: AAA family ATPase [Chthonomonadales bacterium]|nr:AAA family ATPase [Chthonomonadales bacterium]
MTNNRLEVPAEKLRPRLDMDQLTFETTEELPSLDAPVGQERALAALELGLQSNASNFHVFVSGPGGTGRSFAVRKYLDTLAPSRPTPPDWCYLHSFQEPDRPKAISLPAGRGRELARDLDALIEACRVEIPKAFESDSYRERRDEIHERYERARNKAGDEAVRRAQQAGFLVQFSPVGFAIVPLRAGQPLSPEEFNQLPEDVREEIARQADHVREDVEETFRQIHELRKQENKEMEALNKEVASFAAGHLIADLQKEYADLPRVQEHLNEVKEDLLKQFHLFLPQEVPSGAPAALLEAQRKEVFNRYRANVVVDNSQTQGAPVIFETNPTYYNLLGKIDYRAEFGMMVTDFTMVKAGALLRANGGFLVLDALDVLRSPLAWEALVRSLHTREARIENLAEQYGLIPSATLKPEPIPLSVKVVLIGEPLLYHLLYELDNDFQELFRVKADFDSEVDCTPENMLGYARYLATLSRERGIPHFHREAVVRFLEDGIRKREHQGKLSAHLLDLCSLATEASILAEREGSPHVTAAHVERAIAQQEYRSNLLEEKIHERIQEGALLIDVHGEAVGQVNGLSVFDLGDYAFARPSRVTARTSIGSHGVIDIEREVELSGPIHSKGVLILTGYLMQKFGQDKPLALSASLTFEQSYGEVEGDSASSAELYALLSSLSGLPIRQGIGVTGSVNQRGEIQPVGGVTLKIEGFFQVCKTRGLTGEQGVLIPAANLHNLALREEVVRAVEEGKFHIWAIHTVDEGIELLTGWPAGIRGPDGSYPEKSVYGRVDMTLRQYAEKQRQFGGEPPPPSYRDSRRPRHIGRRYDRLWRYRRRPRFGER